MTHTIIFCVALLSAWGCVAGNVMADASPPSASREELAALAAKLPCFSPDDFNYNRDSCYFLREPEASAYTSSMQALHGLGASTSKLESCLHDPDPKIRAVAIMALVDKEDPQVLPKIAALMNDSGETFPGVEMRSELLDHSSLTPTRQSVGSIAKDVVQFYLKPAGFGQFADSKHQGGFDAYWREHKDRTYCASWFLIQVLRASRGTLSLPPEYTPDIQAVRARVDQLPAEDRAWTLLWLREACPQSVGDLSVADAFVTEDECVRQARLLGPEKLMLALQRRMPSSDPDLQPSTTSNSDYRALTLFILHHAKPLLRSQDAGALLAQSAWERDNVYHKILDPTITPWWAIAAAQLQPASADNILHDQAFLDQDEEHQPWGTAAEMRVAMWRQLGESQTDYLINWYFDESFKSDPAPQPHVIENRRDQLKRRMAQTYASDNVAAFLDGIIATQEPSGRKLIASILMSPRAEEIDWDSLQRLSKTIHAWAPAAAVPEENTAPADESQKWTEREKWLARLRASIPMWDS